MSWRGVVARLGQGLIVLGAVSIVAGLGVTGMESLVQKGSGSAIEGADPSGTFTLASERVVAPSPEEAGHALAAAGAVAAYVGGLAFAVARGENAAGVKSRGHA